MKILISNRGEIALRLIRACKELAFPTVAVFNIEDSNSIHVYEADEVIKYPFNEAGVGCYLDQNFLLEASLKSGSKVILPGYGFLSENPIFASLLEKNGIIFGGPESSILELFGNKASAKSFAKSLGIPVVPGIQNVNLDQCQRFFEEQGQEAILLKAVSGGSCLLFFTFLGGGKGMRVVTDKSHIADALKRCRNEARAFFGDDRILVEKLLLQVKHIEVQFASNGKTCVIFGERECTVQRNNQKLIEFTPSLSISNLQREEIYGYSLSLGRNSRFKGLCTFEFLYEPLSKRFYFIEANPRLQVEHTVTEQVYAIDLVKLQLGIHASNDVHREDESFNLFSKLENGKDFIALGGNRFAEFRSDNIILPSKMSLQTRICSETYSYSGDIKPSIGKISFVKFPNYSWSRIESAVYPGWSISPNFDSLMSKIITTQIYENSIEQTWKTLLAKTKLALKGTLVSGVETNIAFLEAVLDHHVFIQQENLFTNFWSTYSKEIFSHAKKLKRYYQKFSNIQPQVKENVSRSFVQDQKAQGFEVIYSATPGTVSNILVSPGDEIMEGQTLFILTSMKMEHEIKTDMTGVVKKLCVNLNDIVPVDAPLVSIDANMVLRTSINRQETEAEINFDDYMRKDLAEILVRKELIYEAGLPFNSASSKQDLENAKKIYAGWLPNENRDAKKERRSKKYQGRLRTARENLKDLIDEDTFLEYGGLAIAHQKSRRTLEDLIKNTISDGLVCGTGSVNRELYRDQFPATSTGDYELGLRTRCMVLSYDYLVLSGTQGVFNHSKKDRLFALAAKYLLPVVIFPSGGGGRPGDDASLTMSAGLTTPAFALWGALKGKVPMIGLVSGYCFAGNAALLGSCDIIIGTKGANLGMAGPAMISGGSMGKVSPNDLGPVEEQYELGVVDILVNDEIEGVALIKQVLSYFQGPFNEVRVLDQRALRACIPENRLRVYDIYNVIKTLADEGSFVEIREGFAKGMICGFIRIKGLPFGLCANNCKFVGGAITADGGTKAADFFELCNAFHLPILTLCDTPGFNVGIESEQEGMVRKCTRMFSVGSQLSVPLFTIVLRKSYGLGAQAMSGGSHREPFSIVSWPTGEFGTMGFEGAVELGYSKELAAAKAEGGQDAYDELFKRYVERLYENGKGLNWAQSFEVDDVIDPMNSRDWLFRSLSATGFTFRHPGVLGSTSASRL
eukprot:augustus_masked-scaffold_15-processed-gene-3.37-mRNA-1 protein AED:0.04 eAED:0.06 QI:0/-1/0/1/-1/1/1/0/1191